MPTGLLERLAGLALDALFPPRCAVCGGGGALLCRRCQEAMLPAAPPRCDGCWLPREGEGRCRRCRQAPPAFVAARAPFVYQGAAREAVHALKFGGLSAIAPLMARPMASLLEEWAPPVDAIVPVPLPGLRERLRGFNQAALLAREVGRRAGLPVLKGALRRRWTPPQTEATGETARRANVRDAFHASDRRLAGRHLLLVDDVLTTGATLDAAARALLATGAEAVWAMTFARED